MPWTSREKIHHLAQLHEESRYYRRFHHTIFSVSIAIYVGLVILQANLLTNTAETSVSLSSTGVVITGITLVILVLLIVPGFLTYLFVHWHFVQGSVRDKIRALQEELKFPDRYLEDAKYKGFTNKPARRKFFIGKGHIIFIILLWLMVFVNGEIFFILSKGIT